MALTQVNQPIRRQREESTLDKVLKGIQIAQGVIGTGLAIPRWLGEKEGRKTSEAQRQEQIDLSKAQAQTAFDTRFAPVSEAEGVIPAQPGISGAEEQPDGGFSVTVKPPTEERLAEGVRRIDQPILDRTGLYKQTQGGEGLSELLKTLQVKKLIREEEPLTEAQEDQFEDAFPEAPMPKTQKDLGEATEYYSSQRIRENRAKKLAFESTRRAKLQERGVLIREQERKTRKVERLSKMFKVSGIGSLEDKMDQVFSIINAPRNEGDIPGYGRAESLVPTMATTGDANKLRRLISSFKNITLKERSGAAVTAPEMARFLEEVGSGKLESEESLLNGLNQLKRSLEIDKATIFAGFTPEAVEAFKSRVADILPDLGGEDLSGVSDEDLFNRLSE